MKKIVCLKFHSPWKIITHYKRLEVQPHNTNYRKKGAKNTIDRELACYEDIDLLYTLIFGSSQKSVYFPLHLLRFIYCCVCTSSCDAHFQKIRLCPVRHASSLDQKYLTIQMDRKNLFYLGKKGRSLDANTDDGWDQQCIAEPFEKKLFFICYCHQVL